MFRAKLVILAAMMLLFVQLECAAACLSQLCSTDFAGTESIPPCHRHHHPSPDRMPDSCLDQILVAPEATTEPVSSTMPMASVPGLPASLLLGLTARGPRVLAPASPPGWKRLFSVVLRI
jgi:hypothetical protein